MLRFDVELSSGFVLVLFRDADGEFVMRLLRKGKPSLFLTPKQRVTLEDLERLMMEHNQRYQAGRMTLVLEENTLMVLADGELAGWGPRPQLKAKISELLRRTLGQTTIPH